MEHRAADEHLRRPRLDPQHSGSPRATAQLPSHRVADAPDAGHATDQRNRLAVGSPARSEPQVGVRRVDERAAVHRIKDGDRPQLPTCTRTQKGSAYRRWRTARRRSAAQRRRRWCEHTATPSLPNAGVLPSTGLRRQAAAQLDCRLHAEAQSRDLRPAPSSARPLSGARTPRARTAGRSRL